MLHLARGKERLLLETFGVDISQLLKDIRANHKHKVLLLGLPVSLNEDIAIDRIGQYFDIADHIPLKSFLTVDHLGEGDERSALDVAFLIAVDAQGRFIEVITIEVDGCFLFVVAAMFGVALFVAEVGLVLAACDLLSLVVQDQLVAFVGFYALDEVPLF